jgi:hypothetical protein
MMARMRILVRMKRPTALLALTSLFLVAPARAQQVADSKADLRVAAPAFPSGKGPRLVIDGGHHNFHTVSGRYGPFAQLMRNNGLRVSGSSGAFSAKSLNGVAILVIANALNKVNDTDDGWKVPNPSAFTPDEIAVLKTYVNEGGSLWLIADHMPFAGAAQDLGAAFGVTFENSFAFRTPPGSPSTPDLFTPENGGFVADSTITHVRQVRTFTGSAFTADGPGVRPLIRLAPEWSVLSPQEAWEFDEKTVRTTGEGKLQGAVIEYGRGRIAVFGEAAMFTAQVTGPDKTPMGLRAPGAEQNKQFALDIANWLVRARPAGR